MRLLETFDREPSARLLSDALFARGIDSTVRTVLDGGFAVWVHQDDQMDAARGVLEEFQRNPQAPSMLELGRRGWELRQRSERDRESRRPLIIDARARLERRRSGIGIVTASLMGISIVVAIVTWLGAKPEMVRYFTIDEFSGRGAGFLGSVLRGEVWRLVSPIFLHFSVLHLLFNLWMLKDLGTAIERVYSHLYLILMVLVVAVLSNLLQYYWSGPGFGGMSGVVYGLFAFLWIRGRFDPSCPLRPDASTVMWLLAWYVLCLTGLLGPIANAAHTGGLVVGGAWGFLSSGYLGRRLRR